jgi:hypothetical protein
LRSAVPVKLNTGDDDDIIRTGFALGIDRRHVVSPNALAWTVQPSTGYRLSDFSALSIAARSVMEPS